MRLRRHSLEQPRHEVDLDVERLELADRLERRLVRVARERDDHPLDVEQLDVQRDVPHAADDREVADVRPPLGRVVVDEADDVEAVLGMLEELLRDQLADAARSDDQRVLDVGRRSSHERPRDDAATRDEHDRRHPEGEELAEVRIGDAA